jgi:hypothetical protein
MARETKNAMVQLSPQSEKFASGYSVLDAAEKRFWDEWRAMLEAVAGEMRKYGLVTRVLVDRDKCWGIFQTAFPHWPRPFGAGVHFELNLDRGLLSRRKIGVALDVEDSVPEKKAVLDCLERVLSPYERNGLLAKETGCQIISDSSWRILDKVVPLAGVSSEKLVDGLQPLTSVAPLVDEALFVKNGNPLWRTDFFGDDLKPRLRFNPGGGASEGGQKFQPDGGLMGSPSVVVNGTMKGNHHDADGRPTHIMVLTNTRDIHNGDEIYLSCVLHTKVGGRLWFYGEGHLDLPDGKRQFPQTFDNPSWVETKVPGKPTWQHVGCRARVRAPEDYDFGKQGAHLFLRTQTEDTDFLINGIEIGHCA